MADTSKLPVVNEVGEVGLVDKAVAQQGFAAGNLRAPSTEEWKKYTNERDFGGGINQAKTAVQGLVQGATLNQAVPLATGAIRAFGGQQAADEFVRGVKGRAETNPEWETGGEILSFAVPGAALKLGKLAKLNTLAKLGEVSGTGLKAYSALGRATEGAVKGLAGEGTIAKLVAKSAGMGAETALMGGSKELGKELTEEMLGNSSLNAEKILATAGHDFLLGAALGGGMGALSLGTKKGLGATRDLLMGNKGLAERM